MIRTERPVCRPASRAKGYKDITGGLKALEGIFARSLLKETGGPLNPNRQIVVFMVSEVFLIWDALNHCPHSRMLYGMVKGYTMGTYVVFRLLECQGSAVVALRLEPRTVGGWTRVYTGW